MAGQRELEAALRDAYERTGQELGHWSKRFIGSVTRKGARQAAKDALKPAKTNDLPEGLEKVIEAGRKDLSIEAIVLESRFSRLFTRAEKAEAHRRIGGLIEPSVEEVVGILNERATGRPIGELPTIRKRLTGASRIACRTIFSGTTTFEHYAFHHGGRTELQFNIGYEHHGERSRFRHGVAISLQRGQSLPDIDVMVPRIERFNEFVRVRGQELETFSMWHFAGGKRSEERTVEPIGSEIVIPNVFIFLGRHQPVGSVDTDLILRDFDRLLGLYEFVEGDKEFPTIDQGPGDTEFKSGLSMRPSLTRMSTQARRIDKSLRHNVIQRALFKHLCTEHGKENVSGECPTGNGTNIDLAVRTGGSFTYFEIKTNLSARMCLREAIGQLLEYSYWPGARNIKELIVVGEAGLDANGTRYLRRLRKKLGLNLHYLQFDVDRSRPVKKT